MRRSQVRSLVVPQPSVADCTLSGCVVWPPSPPLLAIIGVCCLLSDITKFVLFSSKHIKDVALAVAQKGGGGASHDSEEFTLHPPVEVVSCDRGGPSNCVELEQTKL